MDAARAAAMSDPECNPFFRRHWIEPPHALPARVQAVDDLELTGQALLEEWRCMRLRERRASVASGGDRAGRACPSEPRLAGRIAR